jgi:NYN domain
VAASLESVVVFIDYQNVFMAARQCFHQGPYGPADGQIDPLRLGQLIVDRRRRPSTLKQVRVYRGLPDATKEPRAYAANERQTASWVQSPLINVFRRPLNYPRTWPSEKGKEKGVDVALAVDFVRLAVRGTYDVGVLMSTDTDLVPALEAAMEIKTTGVHIEVAAWAAKQANRRLSIDGRLPWCHRLGESDYKSVRDDRDYNQPSS